MGWTAYFISALANFFKFFRVKYKITIDKREYFYKAKSVVAINGFKVAAGLFGPKAAIDDGLLDLVIFNPRSIWNYSGIAFRFLIKPTRRSPIYSHFKGKVIKIESLKDEVRGEVDGETEMLTKVELKVLHKRLKVIA